MTPARGNLYADLRPDAAAERIERLIALPHSNEDGVTIERIVSMGQASPDGFWYDDPRDEWVLLLAGAAALCIEGDANALTLAPGDYVHLPAHCRHRVAWTDPHAPTVWLAVYFPAVR